MDEARVSDLLNRLHSHLDDLAHYHGVHKLETIGDTFLAVTNLNGDQVLFFTSEFNLCTDRKACDT